MKAKPAPPRLRRPELQHAVRALKGGSLLAFADWFDAYRASCGLVPKGYVLDWKESPEQIKELKRRVADAKAHPERLIPMARFFEELRKEIAAKRRKRANLMRRIERFEAHQVKEQVKRG